MGPWCLLFSTPITSMSTWHQKFTLKTSFYNILLKKVHLKNVFLQKRPSTKASVYNVRLLCEEICDGGLAPVVLHPDYVNVNLTQKAYNQ